MIKIFVVFAIVFSLSIALQASENVNMLNNPSFEDKIESISAYKVSGAAGVSGGWSYRLNGSLYLRNESSDASLYGPTGVLDVYSGKDALYVSAIRGGRAEIFQDINVNAGEIYIAGVWVKAYNADGQGFGKTNTDFVVLYLQEIDSVGRILAQHTSEKITSATNGYQQLTKTIRVQKVTSKVRFMLQTDISFNHWHGCVKFDECTFINCR